MESIKIRRAVLGDELILARIQTESWKIAFKDILSFDVLQKCVNIDKATNMYKSLLEKDKGFGYILEANGIPCMIAYWDKARDIEYSSHEELICIHSLPSVWRNGYGTILVNKVFEDMKKSGYQDVMLWVFKDNKNARMFYEKLGFVTFNTEKKDISPTEISYLRQL